MSFDEKSAYALIDNNILNKKTSGYFEHNDTKFTTFSQKPILSANYLVSSGDSTDISGVLNIDPYYFSNAYVNNNNTDKNGLLYNLTPSDNTTIIQGATTQSVAVLSKVDGINTFPTISVGGGAATVGSIVVDNSNNIYVGGDFTTVNDISRNGFVRFDYNSANGGTYTMNNTTLFNTDTFKAGYVVTALVSNPLTGTVMCAYSTGPVSFLLNFKTGFLTLLAGGTTASAMTIDNNDDTYVVVNNEIRCYKAPLSTTYTFTNSLYQIKGTTIAVNNNFVYVNNITNTNTQDIYSAGIFNKSNLAIVNRFTIYVGQNVVGTINVIQRKNINDNNVYVGGNFTYYFTNPYIESDPVYEVLNVINLFSLTGDGNSITKQNVLTSDVITALGFDASGNLFYACNNSINGLFVVMNTPSEKILVVAPYSPQNYIGTLAFTPTCVLMGGFFECQYLSTKNNKGTIVFDVSKGIYMGNCLAPNTPNQTVKSIVQAANNDIYTLYNNNTAIKTSQSQEETILTTFTFNGAVNAAVTAAVTDVSNNVFFGGSFTSVTVNGVTNPANNIAIFGSLGEFKNTSYQTMVTYLGTKTNVRAMTIYQNVLYAGGNQFINAFNLNASGTTITFAPSLSGSNWYVDKILIVLISSTAQARLLLCGSFQGTNSNTNTQINNLALFDLAGALVWPPNNNLNVNTVQAVALDTVVLGGSNYYNLYLSYTTNTNTNVFVVYFTIDMGLQQFPTPPAGVSITAFCIDNENEMVYYAGAYVSNQQPYIGVAPSPSPDNSGVVVVLPKLQGTGYINAMLLNKNIANQLIMGGQNTVFANCTKNLNYTASNSCITLVDFNISHVIDLTYGRSCTGSVITDISNNDSVFGGATIDPVSNEIYVAATVNDNAFAVVRYNANGLKDDTFTQSIFSLQNGCAANAVALDTSNNVYVVGKRVSGGFDNFIVVKYPGTATGDSYTDPFNNEKNTSAYCITVDPSSNNLFVAGNVSKTGTNDQYFVIKLLVSSTTPILSANTTFSSDGIQQAAVGSNPRTKLNSVVLDTCGNVVSAGETGSATKMNMLVVRLTPTGQSDTNFNSNGIVNFDAAGNILPTFSSRAVSAVVVSNQIVVAGNVYNDTLNKYFVCLVMFDANGNTGIGSNVPSLFGTTYKGVSISFGNSTLVVSDMKVSKLGNFLVAGTLTTTTASFVKLYNSNGHPIGIINSSDGLGGVQFTQRVLDDTTNQIYIATSTSLAADRAITAETNVAVQKYFNKESLLPQQYFSGTAALLDNSNNKIGNVLLFINNTTLTLSCNVVLIVNGYEDETVTLGLGATGNVLFGSTNTIQNGFATLENAPITTVQANYIQDGGDDFVTITIGDNNELSVKVSLNNYGGGWALATPPALLPNGQLIVHFTDYNVFEYTATINTNTAVRTLRTLNDGYYGVFNFAPTVQIPITDPNIIFTNTFTLSSETQAQLLQQGDATFNIYDSNGTLVLSIPIEGLINVPPWPPGPIICFKEGSKILTNTGYVRVEELVEGHLVQTSHHGLLPICALGRSRVYNSGSQARIKDRLYAYRPRSEIPELFEELVLTGLHSALVAGLTSTEERQMVAHFGKVKQTDNKYHLLACKDARAAPYEKKGLFNVYHLALECDDRSRHYGIYANGLLVESCSLSHITAMHLC